MASPCCHCSEILNEGTGRYFCGGCGEDLVTTFTDAQVEDFAAWWNEHYPGVSLDDAGGRSLPGRVEVDYLASFKVMRAEAERLAALDRNRAFWSGVQVGALATAAIALLLILVTG